MLQPLKPSCSRACAPQREKPPQGEACRPQQRAAPAPCKQRKPMHSSEDPAQPKINILIFFKKSTVEGRGTAQYSLAGILASNHLFEFHEKSEVFNLGRFFLGLWVGWNACRFLLRLAAGIWLSSALKTQALRKPCNKHQILDPSIQSILHPDGEELVFIRTPSVAENAFDLASEDQGLSSLYD